MKNTGTKAMTRARGKRKKYAPSTPAMAPDAPTVGIVEVGFVKQWVTPAAMPVSK